MPIIAPSILTADFLELGNAVEMLNDSECDWFHLDVMDGVFVPNISFGFPIIQSIQKKAKKPLDVHLMIVQPERYIDHCKQSGAAIITVHYEASTHLHRTVQQIHQAGCRAGVAINPHTPVSVLSEIAADIDVVLLMSVNPGFGGQSFITNTLSKIVQTKTLLQQKNSKALIEIDGGVSLQNVNEIVQAGADALVAGNCVFGSANPKQTIQQLKRVGS